MKPAWNAAEFRVASDNPWRAKFRALQSWYRETVLKIEAGKDELGVTRGNLIDAQAVEDNPHLNFLSDEIGSYAVARADAVLAAGGTLHRDRLLRNMLSSMPLCFNLFGQLRQFPAESAALFRETLGLDIASIEAIHVEEAPPAAEHLNDRTAFDAFVDYKNSRGERCFLAMETKYTEAFTREKYTKPEYETVTQDPRSGFIDRAHLKLTGPTTNQLWRNVLLALSLKWAGNYADAYAVVLSCKYDSTAKRAVDGVKAQRKAGDTFIHALAFERLVEAARKMPPLAEWAGAFEKRYLDLSPVTKRA